MIFFLIKPNILLSSFRKIMTIKASEYNGPHIHWDLQNLNVNKTQTKHKYLKWNKVSSLQVMKAED